MNPDVKQRRPGDYSVFKIAMGYIGKGGGGSRGSLRIGRKDEIPKRFVQDFLQKQQIHNYYYYYYYYHFQIHNYYYIKEIIYSLSKPVISNLKVKLEDSSPFD